MKLIIDIPKDYYEIIKYDVDNHLTHYRPFEIIANGIPLPKEHGRLIDADAVIAEATERMKYPANYKYMECVIAHMKLAPTIIEADKGSEDKK